MKMQDGDAFNNGVSDNFCGCRNNLIWVTIVMVQDMFCAKKYIETKSLLAPYS